MTGFVEFDVFLVHIPANVYSGRYYDHRTFPYRVYKGMANVNDQHAAIRWVNDNQDLVLADIEYRNRHVMKPAADNVFFKPDYTVYEGKVSHPLDHPTPWANYPRLKLIDS